MIRNNLRRPALAIATGLLAAGAVATVAAPAMASTCGTNCVSASLSVGQTLTLSVSTPSIAFTGSPGGVSNTPVVNYTLTDNDPAGAKVSVAATSSNLTSQYNVTTPVSQISLWGPVQQAANFPQDGMGGAVPVNLSTTPVTTVSTTNVSSAGGDSYTDSYGFVGSSVETGPVTTPGTAPTGGATGSPIPNLPSGQYAVGVQYTALGN
jgi:hypothetical protein